MTETIEALVARHWRPGWGAQGAEALRFAAETIAEVRPGLLVELGTGAGLSAGVYALCLDAIAGSIPGSSPTLVTLDLDAAFYADHSVETGFLIPRVRPGGPTTIERHTGVTIADLPALLEARPIDLLVIDADHRHPWPTIELLVGLAHAAPRLTVLLDDLGRFRTHRTGASAGPKFLADQLRAIAPLALEPERRNIGRVALDRGESGLAEALNQALADALLLPWTMPGGLPEPVLAVARSAAQCLDPSGALTRALGTASRRPIRAVPA